MEQLIHEVMAEIIKERIEHVRVFQEHTMAEGTCSNIAIKLAIYFTKDNPKFNYKKFLWACGIKPTVSVQFNIERMLNENTL